MLNGLFRGRTTFGLDIGYDTLKVVQLKGKKHHLSLHAFNTVPIPPNSLTRTEIKESAKIAKSLRQALNEAKPHRIDASYAISAIPESFVFSKIVTLPQMKPADLEKTIAFEASEIFPIPLEEVYLDWQILGHTNLPPTPIAAAHTPAPKKPVDIAPHKPAKPANKPTHPPTTNASMEVLVIAAPRKLVQSYQALLKEAGLELAILETKPIAVARSLMLPNDKSGFLFLDIGAEASSISIIDDGILRFTGTAATGGQTIIKAISESQNLPTEQIEQMLKSSQMTQANEQQYQALKQAVSPIADEVNHAIRFYYNRIQTEGRINTLRLAGGGANFTAINEIITEQTGCKTETGNPLINIQHIPKQTSASDILPYTVALGSALREFME